MTVAVDKAIFTRWDDAGLDTTITGGLWPGRAEEGTGFPYASYDNISDVPMLQTHTGRYNIKTVQISVWDITRDLAGSHIKLIKNNMVHSDRALTDPTASLATDEIIKNIEPSANPIVLQESDEVWQGVITLDITYVADRNLIPV